MISRLLLARVIKCTAASANKPRAWFLSDKGNLDASGLYASGD